MNDWTIGVAGVESHSVITTTNPEVRYEPRGTFWLVYIDAVNNGSSPRSVGETLDFTLTDAAGTIYLERSDRGKHPELREFARVFGRDYLDTQVPPGGTARTMLVFVTTSESQPRTLDLRPIGPDGKVSNSAPQRFDLPQGR